ncbi:MAG TPA: hypothetical protein VFA26_15475 [Gemmataceae bacterium]|nr:hypothetical protein [Gemmataceae bacterium]
MPRCRTWLPTTALLTGLLALALAVRPARPADDPAADPARGVRPGMSPAEVERRLGRPSRIARQVLYRRCLEQWLYDGPPPLRVEFSRVRGEPAQVQSVHPHSKKKP